MGEWQYGDQVMARHRTTSPQCPFVLHTSDNVPAPVSGHDAPHGVTAEDADDVGPETPRLLTNNTVRHHLPPLDIGGHQEDARSASPESGPESLDYRHEAVRLASYTHWTVPFIQPADLARAGFYSLNNLDSCRYFRIFMIDCHYGLLSSQVCIL